MNINQCVCLADFRIAAQNILSKAAFQYLDSGSSEEQTLKENEISFHRLMIIPRILKSISNPDMTTTVFGKQLSLPFGFAPTAMQIIYHPDGEIAPAKVAFQNNLIYCLSNLSNKSFTQISQANQSGIRFLQMYVSKDWQLTLNAIRLAQRYKFTGLAITVDAQILGLRKRQKKYAFDSKSLPFPVLQQIAGNDQSSYNNSLQRKGWQASRDLTLNWQTIKKIRQNTSLKIVLKGIMHPEDAAIAVNYCDAIWVSNHGGRQLDSISSTIDILPSIRLAAGNNMPIFIDGGVRTGNDIFKCLALGANYVFLGRPVQYSLVFGQPGVSKMVSILHDELKRCMVLVGCHSLSQITAESIVPQPSL